MIKEIFLPEKIGNTRIIAQRIVGLAVQEDLVTLSLVYAKRSATYVEKIIEQKIVPGPENTYLQRAADVVKTLLATIKKYDQLIVAIPASNVIFKELQVPFKEAEKIRMVLNYEIESMLPFSTEDAIIDFIITKSRKDEDGSQILVAAIRQEDLKNALDIYQQAGIDPNGVTIDLFAYYSLYQQIPDYFNISGGSAIVDIGNYSTRVAFLQNGQLRLTRAMQRGLMTIAESISTETKIGIEDVLDRLSKYGLKLTGDENYDSSLQKHAVSFFNDIQFTLNSFGLKLNYYEGINKILFAGRAKYIKDLVDFSNKSLQIPSEIFDCKKIFENRRIRNSTRDYASDWSHFVVALGTALPSELQSEFNLRIKSFVFPAYNLFGKKLMIAAAIIMCIISTIAVTGYMQLSHLKDFASKFENQEINKLKKLFPEGKKPKAQNLARMVLDAEKMLKEKADLWAPFEQQKLRPLDLWLEVTKLFDKKEFNITVEVINFNTARDEEAKEQLAVPTVIVEGYFKSKSGESNFAQFEKFTKRFNESKFFTLPKNGITEGSSDGTSVKFSIKLNQKEV